MATAAASVFLFFLSLAGTRPADRRIATSAEVRNGTDDVRPAVAMISADGDLIAVGLGSFIHPAELQVVNLRTGVIHSRVQFERPYNQASAVAISPNRRYVAAGAMAVDGAGAWFVFDRTTQRVSKQFPRRKENVFALRFNPDGNLLAHSGFGNKTAEVRLYRVSDGRTIARFSLSVANHIVTELAFSPDGKLLALAHHNPDPDAAENGRVIVWDWRNNKISHRLSEFKYPVSRLAFSPSGNVLVTAGGPLWRARRQTAASEILVWRPDGSRRTQLSGPRGEIKALGFSLDGKRLAASGIDFHINPTIHTWDVGNWKPGRALRVKTGNYVNALYFPRGGRLFSASVGGRIRRWDVQRARLTGQTTYWKRTRRK